MPGSPFSKRLDANNHDNNHHCNEDEHNDYISAAGAGLVD
jgi:hypothetical protein